MPDCFADLHVHTFFSDGTFEPSEIFARAAASDISVISITDHDTTDAYRAPFIRSQAYRETGVSLIPGAELSAYYQRKGGEKTEVHVLAYYIDTESDELCEYFQQYQDMRYRRAQEIIRRLRALDVSITMDDLEKEVRKKIYGRLHIAQCLVSKGYVSSPREAFHTYIGVDGPAYVAKEQKTLSDLSSLILSCGGIPVIAHPGIQGLEKELDHLKKQGIRGVEVFHPDHKSTVTQKLLKESEKLRLCITGGSDFHGHAKSDISLGSVKIPCKYVTNLKEARDAGLCQKPL